jgi:hypothetical protein
MEEEAARTAEEYRKWESSWLRAALDCLAADVPGAARIAVADAVRQELPSLYDLREYAELVKEKVEVVIDNVLQPYRRRFETARAVAEAVSEARWSSIPYSWEQEPIIEQRAREQTSEAIAELPEGATYADKAEVARSTGQRIGKEYQEQQRRERAQRQEQVDREFAQRKREGEVDSYLGEVLLYLAELSNSPDADIEFAQFEIFDLAPKIRAAIRPSLLQEPSLNSLNAKQRVRDLVDECIESLLNAAGPEMKG